MAQLNSKYESFISMLLGVSGRARPGDIQGVAEDEAIEILRAYAAKYSENALGFEGDVLVIGVAPAAAPAPAVPPVTDAPIQPAVDPFVAPPAVEPVAQAVEPVADFSFGPDPSSFEFGPALDANAFTIPAETGFDDIAPSFEPESGEGPAPSRKRSGLPLYLWILLAIVLLVAAAGIAFITGVLDPVVERFFPPVETSSPKPKTKSNAGPGGSKTATGSATASGSAETTTP